MGCRFALVDAYNDDIPLKFYQKNDFAEIFPSEDEEKKFREIADTEKLNTRLLYFDLMELNKEKEEMSRFLRGNRIVTVEKQLVRYEKYSLLNHLIIYIFPFIFRDKFFLFGWFFRL
jgi:hypothetical protein